MNENRVKSFAWRSNEKMTQSHIHTNIYNQTICFHINVFVCVLCIYHFYFIIVSYVNLFSKTCHEKCVTYSVWVHNFWSTILQQTSSISLISVQNQMRKKPLEKKVKYSLQQLYLLCTWIVNTILLRLVIVIRQNC